MKKFLSDVVFIMLINVKMPTIVGILTFMSRINCTLNWVEYEKFIDLGPGTWCIGTKQMPEQVWAPPPPPPPPPQVKNYLFDLIL